MTPPRDLPTSRDALLFTPGPLTTSLDVKLAMLHDAGSWHREFNAIVRDVRGRLLAVVGLGASDEFDSILMQGSGTFGVEAVVSSVVPRSGRLLVLANGAYGERIGRIAAAHRIDHQVVRADEDTPVDPASVDEALAADPGISHVALVHCETTTGLLNPLEPVGAVVARHRRSFIVDAMSSLGALPIDPVATGIDYLVSSANKCLEGVPGFSFVLARRAALLETEGSARTLSLDLLGQLRGFESNEQFRFTPPTHAILAFHRALDEFDREGGVAARGRRYAANHAALLDGMGGLGFRPFLRPEVQSPIITAFHTPSDPAFAFQAFYDELSARGMIIYPGKLTRAQTFRVGNIGRLFPADMRQLVHAVREALAALGCRVPLDT